MTDKTKCPHCGESCRQQHQREITSLVMECGRYSTCLLAASQRLNINELMEVPNAIDELIAERDRLMLAAEEALSHVEELREAWRTGAIREHDGKGGLRSNRNVDVEVKLRKAIGL